MESGRLGDRGARAQLHVGEELKHDPELAQIQNHNTMAPTVQEVLLRLRAATHSIVQVSCSLFQTGKLRCIFHEKYTPEIDMNVFI
jgi:hypothetical protein